MICYEDIQNLLTFLGYNHKMNTLICLLILYPIYSINQKTSSSIIRNSNTEIKCLNIAKISRNLPMFNMEQHVLYTYTRKCVEAKFNFFEKSLPCAQKNTQRTQFLPCASYLPWAVSRGTRQNVRLPCARPLPWAFSPGTRQTESLPCARCFAHGKLCGTRQTHVFW